MTVNCRRAAANAATAEMLARGAESTVRKAPEKDPLHGEPSEHDLVMPGDLISEASAMRVVQLVAQVQEHRISLSALFEDKYEDLVTAGAAEKYQALVERFKAKNDVLTQNLARLEQRLRDLGHGDIASILGRVASFEAKRWGLSCDLQTLRQQHSVADMDTRDELSEQVATTSKRLQHAQSAVQEAMEELRCEAADLDE